MLSKTLAFARTQGTRILDGAVTGGTTTGVDTAAMTTGRIVVIGAPLQGIVATALAHATGKGAGASRLVLSGSVANLDRAQTSHLRGGGCSLAGHLRPALRGLCS